MPHHAKLREAKGDEDVYAVKHHEEVHRTARSRHQDQRAAAHEQDTVVGHKPIAQRGKAGGKPAVQRHVGQDPGAVQEACLRRDEQQGRLRSERDEDKGQGHAVRPGSGQLLEEHSIERLAFLGCHPEEQICHQQAGHRHRQRYGHVAHGAFAGLDPRLAQDGETVAHSLNSSVGSGAHAVRAQHQQDHPQPPQLAVRGSHIHARVVPNLADVA